MRDSCRADLNGDHVVDSADLGLLVAAWGESGSDPADLDHDGLVAASDLGMLLVAWGPCAGCPPIEFVHGPAEDLVAIRNGGARVLMIGDSISNFGSTQFTSLFHAAVCTWKPIAWRGIHTSPASGGDQGHHVLSGMQAPPGISNVFSGLAPDLAGHYTCYAEAFRHDMATAGSQLFTATVDHRIFATAHEDRPRLYQIGRPFENAAGDVDFVNRSGPVEFGFTVLSHGAVSGAGLRYADRVRMRPWHEGTPETPLTTVSFDVTSNDVRASSCSLIWNSGGMDGTPLGSTTQVKVLGDPEADDDEVLVIQDFYFGRPDRPDGLTVAYAGYGGWRAVNHLHPMGDPHVPVVNGERPGYSTEGITQRIKGLGSTHYLIHLGTNDLSPGSSLTAAEFVADLEGVMNRIRQVHADLLRPPPVFVILGLYLTAQDGETTNRPVKEAVRAALVETARQDRGFVYLDLGGYLASRFGLSNIDDLNPFADEWLFDGVHLNAEGAEGIGTWIWSCIEAATECTSG